MKSDWRDLPSVTPLCVFIWLYVPICESLFPWYLVSISVHGSDEVIANPFPLHPPLFSAVGGNSATPYSCLTPCAYGSRRSGAGSGLNAGAKWQLCSMPKQLRSHTGNTNTDEEDSNKAGPLQSSSALSGVVENDSTGIHYASSKECPHHLLVRQLNIKRKK